MPSIPPAGRQAPHITKSRVTTATATAAITATAAAAIVISDWTPVLGLIFGGCCSNVFALESLVREVPKCGNLITFAQFIFITLIGLPHHLHTAPGALGWIPRLRPRQVPLRRWLFMVGLYFCVSLLNNIALGYKISIPLHIVFRSTGLIANMVCGYLVMHKHYPVKQVVAVILVTVGVVIATLTSISGDKVEEGGGSMFAVHDSVVGILLLTMGVFLAAILGLYQETTYKKYGKHWKEGLFYNHLLALPMFLPFYRDILNQARALSLSPPIVVSLDQTMPLFGKYLATRIHLFSVPRLWLSLIGNVLSQLVCVSGVHRFTSMSTSLTLNVVLNLRKLVSLVLSVLLFKNKVTLGMIFGCTLVFAGTFAYSQIAGSTKQAIEAKSDKEEPKVDEGVASFDVLKSDALDVSSAHLSEAMKKRRPAQFTK
ncbi:golgi uridine diphosphate-N- acetylglucosamine transporter [Kickxella alabastrina]|nr:golgi uridine diphosphate-N- acetylglucosamine transporter [Kickxella alabastrina]